MNERNRHAPIPAWGLTKNGLNDQTVTQKNDYGNKNRDPLWEMKALKQWVCTRYDGHNGESAAPLDIFGNPASIKDPKTWDTYENCKRSSFPSVGFVLTENDPYTIIDLDDKPANPATPEQKALHQKIIDTFDSYTERSVSGRGYHIIIKAKLDKGVRSRDKVEMYSSDRYLICTEDVVKEEYPKDQQKYASTLYDEMDTTAVVDLVQVDSSVDDKFILDTASSAANKDKFLKLCKGEWQNDYPSQSEADLALMTIIAYYTKDNTQVKRIFRMSELGRRKKAQREDYLNRNLQKIRAHEVTPVETAHIKKQLVTPVTIEEPVKPQEDGYKRPPGFMGEIVDCFYAGTVRPVFEISLAGALALCAGLWGRGFNISDAGLNQYIILLARTGRGKEGMATVINRIIKAAVKTMPSIRNYMGPGSFASGQALLRVLDSQPCFLSVIGEFGITMQQLCDPRANPAQKMLKKMLLDLYGKSGADQYMQASVYADKEKNTKIIYAPSLSILGEGTHASFFNNITEEHILDGLMPRFTTIQYDGERPELNEKPQKDFSKNFIDRLVGITEIAVRNEQQLQIDNIAIDSNALELFRAFNKFCDEQINTSNDVSVSAELWNRAHLKALKLSGLLAVANQNTTPVVDIEAALWAVRFVKKEINDMLVKFETGEHSDGVTKQEFDLCRVIKQYSTLTPKKRKSYRIPQALAKNPNLIPFEYLRRKLRDLKAFKNDCRGPVNALKALLQDLVMAGILTEFPKQEALDEYGTRAGLYVKGPQWGKG